MAAGRLLHFAPEDGVYVYGRVHDSGRMRVVVNKNDLPVSGDPKRCEKFIGDAARETTLDGNSVPLTEALYVPARSVELLTFR